MVVMDMDVVDTKANTKTKTNTKCFKDPMYVIFLKSRGFKIYQIWQYSCALTARGLSVNLKM